MYMYMLFILLFPDCPALLVENAMVNPCTGIIPHGSSAIINCVSGFTMVGKSIVTCFEGKYDSTPSCKADCPALYIPNAVVKPPTQIAHGKTVRVDCTGIYTLIGNSSPTCRDGSFDERPSCVFDKSAMIAVNNKKISVKVKGDRLTPSITGSEVLPDGRLLVVDFRNNKVKLFSTLFRHEDSVTIERPYDVAVINDTAAIVSSISSEAPQLHFLRVAPRLQLDSVISLDKKCFGIDVYNDTIYLSCHKYNERQGHVRLLDMDGKLKGTLGVTEEQNQNYYTFRRPYYVRVGRLSGNVYVSDWSADKITCLSPKGEVIYEFSHESLTSPDNFILDDRDNLLVCGSGSNILEIINDGQDHKCLLTAADGLYSPESLVYRQTDGVLLVGEYNRENMHLFQLHTSD